VQASLRRACSVGYGAWSAAAAAELARHYSGITWGDFSNMNGGSFAPDHESHQTGNDIDGWCPVYYKRDKKAAEIMWEAHTAGKALVKSCHKELAELYEARLLEKGLSVSIEPGS
jgi:murein endopeptidase